MVKTEDMPDDTKQVLLELWNNYVEETKELPEFVETVSLPILNFRDAVVSEVDTWSTAELSKGYELVTDIVLHDAKFPPIIVDGDIVLDGFYRLFAYRMVNRTHCECIDLAAFRSKVSS